MNLLVKGSYSVLTLDQAKEIEEYRLKKNCQKVYFKVNKKSTGEKKVLERYFKDYPFFSFWDDEEYSEILSYKQDKNILQGDYRKYPVYIRGLMIEYNLFRKEIAYSLVKPKRITHIQSVADLSAELARINGYDVNKAEIAGLFHDCTKKLDKKETARIMRLTAPKRIGESFPILHQYTGSYFLKHELGYTDYEVYMAIRWHCDGNYESTLGKIIYLADKLDPTRGLDNKDILELAKKDLDQAFIEEKKRQKEYLLSQNVVVV